MRLKMIAGWGLLALACLSTACVPSIRDGPIGAGVDLVEAPAVVLLEQHFGDGFRRAAAQLEGVDQAQARVVAREQAEQVQRLNAARFAYDVTLGLTSSLEAREIVTAARRHTDDALAELGRRLALALAEPPV